MQVNSLTNGFSGKYLGKLIVEISTKNGGWNHQRYSPNPQVSLMCLKTLYRENYDLKFQIKRQKLDPNPSSRKSLIRKIALHKHK